MAQELTIPAPHRIDGDGHVLYGPGDPIPIDEARRLGLVPGEPTKKRAKKGPKQDRMKKRREDR